MLDVRRGALIVLIFSGLLVSACIPFAHAADSSVRDESAAIGSRGYLLGAGDVINITVYGEDDLSRQKYRLPDSGLITFPFGEVRALGLHLVELESRIADGLRGGYLVNPRVSVSMEEYRPFFINGQVANPGAYPYQPGISVRKAVSLAGGFKERASESKIFVMREADPLHAQAKIGLDAAIYPGDTVTVEESFF
ncbi:MAG: polysaccharide biosynthesis/export family protein [Gallionella sp.]|nr:polysaccharide biosynthesis/export family protein [Gallionella sp.]